MQRNGDGGNEDPLPGSGCGAPPSSTPSPPSSAPSATSAPSSPPSAMPPPACTSTGDPQQCTAAAPYHPEPRRWPFAKLLQQLWQADRLPGYWLAGQGSRSPAAGLRRGQGGLVTAGCAPGPGTAGPGNPPCSGHPSAPPLTMSGCGTDSRRFSRSTTVQDDCHTNTATCRLGAQSWSSAPNTPDPGPLDWIEPMYPPQHTVLSARGDGNDAGLRFVSGSPHCPGPCPGRVKELEHFVASETFSSPLVGCLASSAPASLSGLCHLVPSKL